MDATIKPPTLFEELDSVLALMAAGMSSEIHLTRPAGLVISRPQELDLNLNDNHIAILRAFRPDILERMKLVE